MRELGCLMRPRYLWKAEPGADVPLFPERLSIHGEKDVCPHRLFVQARHVFSYCELGRLGWSGPWREMVDANIDFLVERGRRADGFYIHRFDHKGGVFDARADLYDQAFMLLALAYAGRALQRPDLFRAAEDLGDALERNWRLPHGGYYEGRDRGLPALSAEPAHASARMLHRASSTRAAWRVGAGTRRISRGFAPARSSMRRAGRCSNISTSNLEPVRRRGRPSRRAGPLLRMGMAVRDARRNGACPQATLISDGMTRFARRLGSRPRSRRRDQRGPDRRLGPQSGRTSLATDRTAEGGARALSANGR